MLIEWEKEKEKKEVIGRGGDEIDNVKTKESGCGIGKRKQRNRMK